MKGNPSNSFGYLLIMAILVLLASCAGRTNPSPAPPVRQPYGASPSAPVSKPYSGSPEVVEKCHTNLSTPRTITHEVGPMETIWRISRMYDVSAQSIYAANGLKSGEPIHIGQKLVIPNARMLRHVIALYPSSRWKYIIVHHTATEIGNARLVDCSHQDRGFWNGLGYHFLIDNGTLGKGDGQIEQAPRWIKQQNGAHCKAGGMNNKGIGIALVGNFNHESPTRNQLESLTYLLNTLSRYYHIPSSNILGHRDVEGAATDCPGKRFPWSSVRQCLSTSR